MDRKNKENLEVSKNEEKNGYDQLVNADFEGARKSFKRAVNGYRNAYELAELLQGIKNEDMGNNPAKRKIIIESVIAQGYANKKQIEELRKLEN